MTPELINLLIWVPFLAVVLIAGLIFCWTGYKKGLWRSLISLGVTLVSALISALVSGLLASVIAPSITNMVPDVNVEGIDPTLYEAVFSGLIKNIIAVLLFGVLMFLFTLIFKLVANAIKRHALLTETTPMKLGGLGVRLADTIIYAIILTLPIYGTIHTYAPIANESLTLVEKFGSAVEDLGDISEIAEFKPYINTVATHPLTSVAGFAPFRLLYGSTQSFKLGDNTINITEMLKTATEAVTLVNKLSDTEMSELTKEEQTEVLDFIRDNVVETEWFYAVSDQVISTIKEELPAELGSLIDDVLDSEEEDFKESAVAIVDLAELALENNILESLENEELDLEKLYEDGVITDALAIINSSSQLTALKATVIVDVCTDVFGTDENTAKEFFDTLNLEKLTDADDLKKEAEVVKAIAESKSPAVIVDVIANHPMFTEESLDVVLDTVLLVDLLGVHSEYTDLLGEQQVQDSLKDKIKETALDPEVSFEDHALALQVVLNYDSVTPEHAEEVIDKGGEPIKFALELVGEERLKSEFNVSDELIERFKQSAEK